MVNKSMSPVFLTGVTLSNNKEAKVVDSVDGINGKCNLTGDGRQYVVITFQDEDLFRASKTTRVYSQNSNGKWPGVTPKQMLAALENAGTKLKIEGAAFFTATVEEYEIENPTDQSVRKVSSYTSVVLPKETVETVFKNNGHTIVAESTTTVPANDAAAIASTM
jgi:hypothetical protein